MFRIKGIDHIVLRVADGEAMVRFYCEALGCTVERREDEIGLVQLRAGAQLIDIVPVDSVLGREGTISACASSRSRPRRSTQGSPNSASRPARSSSATVPKGGVPRSISTTRKATASSSRARRTSRRGIDLAARRRHLLSGL
jgi:hypothetical protein